jgi:hypothetical protein
VRRDLFLVPLVALLTSLPSYAKTCLDSTFAGTTVTLPSYTRDDQLRAVVSGAEFSGSDAHSHGYFGIDTGNPITVVSEIKVRAGDREIFVPLSAYGDIANARRVCFEQQGNHYLLTITGGSTSTAFEAVLEFDQQSILKRRIRLSEFPDQRWEETIYSFVKDRGQ